MNEEIEKFITCTHCKQIPNQPPLYNCKEGHVICELCCLNSTIGDTKRNICSICNCNIISRNVFGEELLKVYSHNDKNKIMIRNNNSSNSTSEFSNVNSDKKNSLISLHISHSLANTSKRPIICPNSMCKKMIAVTQLIAHFQFDHSRTPMECLEFNQPKSLILSLNSMKYGQSHCVGLLLLNNEIDSSSSTALRGLENKVAFPLLAAKICCVPDLESVHAQCSHNEAPAEWSSQNGLDSEEMNASDIIIIWICGNLDMNLNCLIEVSDEKQSRIYSYFGLVNTLRANNDPKSVFERADCLLLHSTSVKNITSNGQYPMDLKVLISYPVEEL